MGLYSTVVRPLIFRLDPEQAHRLALRVGAFAGFTAPAMRAVFRASNPRLASKIAGLQFENPIGLSAGFDKSGEAIEALAGLGFGHVEIGSVSADPSAGNPRPRLFRLPEDRAIVVAYGVPNDGAPTVAARLAKISLPVPLGINIVKTNRGRGTPPESADQIIGEYVEAAHILAPYADYLMFNLSCPNTEDGRDFFADRGHLDASLAALGEIGLTKPVFLKVSPLGGVAMIEQLLEAAQPHNFISGFMFNLPSGMPGNLKSPASSWKSLPGAVSGPPAADLLDRCLRETWRRIDRRRYALIASGGVFTAEDAYAKIKLGASLVQLLTALVYEGPGVVRRITHGLAVLLEHDGFKNVADAVGAEAN
jgi:dihydroorotate dehydrogenase